MHRSPFWTLTVLSLTFFACAPDTTPVGKLSVEPRTLTLAYPGRAELVLDWWPERELAGLDGTAHAFVHLLGETPGTVLRTFDHPLPESWTPGEALSYPVTLWQSALAAPLQPGTYRLSVGLYDLEKHRWALEVEGEEVDDQEYVVAEVVVPPAGDTGPEVSFSGSWLPVENLEGNRQIPAVRWLEADGAIEFPGLAEPLQVDLAMTVPDLDRDEFYVVLDEGQDEPAVRLESECLDGPVDLTGFRSHDLELTLRPAAETAGCSVRIDPNYQFLHREQFHKRSVMLEKLGWSAGRS